MTHVWIENDEYIDENIMLQSTNSIEKKEETIVDTPILESKSTGSMTRDLINTLATYFDNTPVNIPVRSPHIVHFVEDKNVNKDDSKGTVNKVISIYPTKCNWLLKGDD